MTEAAIREFIPTMTERAVTKDILKSVVQKFIEENSVYIIRVMAEEKGHMVLFQPPNHPDFQATGTFLC